MAVSREGGLLEPTVLAAVKRSTAHRALALDCQALAMPLLKLLPTLEGNTSLKREEVERALFNADRLNDAPPFGDFAGGRWGRGG